MARVLFFLALLVAAASAFVSPASNAISTPAFARTVAPKMMPIETVDVAISSIASNAQLLATSSDDFGGAFIPVAGIALLATFILYLSPPLAGEE